MDLEALASICAKKVKECSSVAVEEVLHPLKLQPQQYRILPMENFDLTWLIFFLVKMVRWLHSPNVMTMVYPFPTPDVKRFHIPQKYGGSQGIFIEGPDAINIFNEETLESSFFGVLTDLAVGWKQVSDIVGIAFEKHINRDALHLAVMFIARLRKYAVYDSHKAHVRKNNEISSLIISFDRDEDFVEFENRVFKLSLQPKEISELPQ